MPNYKALPQQGSITIEDALRAGKTDITHRSRAILIIGTVVGILLPVCGLSIWLLPIAIATSIIAALVYTVWITPQWRIWAYAGVVDIHQFQRCAELELLLPKQSFMLATGIMSMAQRATLARLQKRFEEDPPFIDDPDVQQVSRIYPSLLSLTEGSTPAITISREGIETSQHGFYPWKDIWNEHVGAKFFVSQMPGLGYATQGTRVDYFCFFCPDLQVEIPISSLNATSGELDQMLYVHRGRYQQSIAGAPVTIPLKRGS